MPKAFRIEKYATDSSQHNESLIKVFLNETEGLPVNIDLQKRYSNVQKNGEQFLQRIRDFEIRKDDVWVITMPKSGTTWMIELVWLLMNDFDYPTALNVEQEDRCPFLEFCSLFPKILPLSLDVATKMESPRLLKSHLPIPLLPKDLWTVKPKIIYIARDAKDCAVSNYHFLRMLGTIDESIGQFLDRFLNDKVLFGPVWPHVAEFWTLRNEDCIYFTSFERMKSNLPGIIHDVSEFIQRPIAEGQMSKLLEHLSFESMKNNPMCNHVNESRAAQEALGTEKKTSNFIRKGKVGSYKEELSDEMIKKFDEWTETSLKPFGVTADEILYS